MGTRFFLPGFDDRHGTAWSRTTLPSFSHAFQPIVDTVSQQVFSHEALVRGPGDEPACAVLQQIPTELKAVFDQQSSASAIALATRCGLACHLNLNFSPQSLAASSRPLDNMLGQAQRHGLAIERLVLEVTEDAVITDHARFAALLGRYRALGLKVAIDDFGAGYSGLNLLAEFQPDQVKIDMNLVRGIERHGPRQAIVRAILQVCTDLGIDVVVEGVETTHEYGWFAAHGVRLFQGFLFAKPGFECFPAVRFP